jgi:hypothetical protein
LEALLLKNVCRILTAQPILLKKLTEDISELLDTYSNDGCGEALYYDNPLLSLI